MTGRQRPADCTAESATLLRSSFERARNHRLWRDFYAGIDDFSEAPALDKVALRRALRDFSPSQEHRGVYLVRSGGSTREPLIVPVDITENHRQRAELARQLTRAEMFGPKTVALNLFGYADLYRSAAIFDDLLERCSATTLPMSAQAADSDLLKMARRFRPSHLLGTPSRLIQFARFLAARGQDIQVPDLLYAGEFLRDSVLDLFRTTFGTQRLWSLYGAAETGIWAWCDATVQPRRFSILPGVVVEVLSPDEDGYGALAVTNSWRNRFPVFRYRIGDLGRLVHVDEREVLELLARDSQSFQFCELKHDLGALDFLVSEAESFQVQLSCTPDHRERIRLLIVLPTGAQASQSDLASRSRALRELLQCPRSMAEVLVETVDASRFHVDPATAKVPELVDFRH